MKFICVFGSSSERLTAVYLERRRGAGQIFAKKNCGVVYGAGKYGIMGAVARGVRENGELIGVSPDFFVDMNVLTRITASLCSPPPCASARR